MQKSWAFLFPEHLRISLITTVKFCKSLQHSMRGNLTSRINTFLLSATKLRRLCFYRRLSVHGGVGVSASVHAGIPSPGADTPSPGADTPLEQTPPQDQTPPQEQTPPRSRHPPGPDTPPSRQTDPPEQTPPESTPPLEQTPPRSRHPPPDTVTAADGTHPTGMHSCVNNVCFLFWITLCKDLWRHLNGR